MAPDRLPRTPAFPKIKKGRGPIQVEEANGTTAKVMSVSALHLWHPDRFPQNSLALDAVFEFDPLSAF
jgi:hypothetical protein